MTLFYNYFLAKWLLLLAVARAAASPTGENKGKEAAAFRLSQTGAALFLVGLTGKFLLLFPSNATKSSSFQVASFKKKPKLIRAGNTLLASP